ncbi:MAG: prepilin peptidase [Planctomycetota bacterium]
MYLLALGATARASAFDLRSREIPNWIAAGLFASSLIVLATGRHPAGASDLFLGATVAAAGSVALFAVGAMGGGDVKLLVALGATLGIQAFVPFLVATFIVGGILALIAKRRGESEIAYAPAMFLGLLALVPLVWLTR